MRQEKKELIDKMNQIIEKPGGKQAMRYVLNALGGIPFAGGAIAGIGQVWGEKEQQEFNEVLTGWASKTDDDLKEVLHSLNQILQTPTKPKMALLFGEILGNDLATEFLFKSKQFLHLALNNETINELQPFNNEGWISMTPTHSTVQMGSGNRVGNNIEELKRPWGFGTTFDIEINESYFSE